MNVVIHFLSILVLGNPYYYLKDNHIIRKCSENYSGGKTLPKLDKIHGLKHLFSIEFEMRATNYIKMYNIINAYNRVGTLFYFGYKF